MDTTTTEPRWKGWYRPSRRSPWRLLVEGDDERETHSRMIDASPGGDLLMTAGNVNPNDTERKVR